MDLNKPPAPDTSPEATPETTPQQTPHQAASQQTAQQPTGSPIADPQEDLRWAAAAHLSMLVGLVGIPGLLGPLVIWLIKKGESDFFDAQAKEALNFGLSLAIYLVGLIFLIVMVSINESVAAIVLFSLALVATLVAGLILPIVAGVRAANGDTFHYPLSLRLVK